MATLPRPTYYHHDYTVACICPLGVESASVEAILDQLHTPLPTNRDQNAYTLGSMGEHNVVIAIMSEIGNNVAAAVAAQLLNDFPSIRFGLLVGIGGGVPGEIDVRLGDVVVSQPTKTCGGVVQYHIGKKSKDEEIRFERIRSFNKPPAILSAHVRKLDSRYRRLGHNLSRSMADLLQKYPVMQAEYAFPTRRLDHCFLSTYRHQAGATCDRCDRQQTITRLDRPDDEPRVHYGAIGSVNAVVRDATLRDDLREDMHILCIEMEAAGLMDSFPCLVIRGICDYADSHKNKKWQGYSALVAAVYAKDLLGEIAPGKVQAQNQVIMVDSTKSGRQSLNLSGKVITYGSSKILLLFTVLLFAYVFWRGAPNISTGQQVTNGIVNGKSISISGPKPKIDFSSIGPIGLCLNQAPYIETSMFIGRETELNRMRHLLRPGQQLKGQIRLVLGGVGGVGKTQLAIAYAKQEMDSYDTIIWIDATSEATLISGFKSVFERLVTVQDLEDLRIEQIVVGVKRWLSTKSNMGWLLIFDSYDNPASYDLRSYYPYTFHGTIIITTRLPSHIEGIKLEVKALSNIEHSLQILQMRSQRGNISSDYYARRVVERLGGFPLALVSAGAYLRHSTLTFEQYLQAYETRWNVHFQRPLHLPEYQNRTLYTTWDLSYQRLEEEDPQAAQMLKLLAYFGHQSITIGFFNVVCPITIPDWLRTILTDTAKFDSIMRKLADHCFIEIQSGSEMYSMHTCVHDWSLQRLNQQVTAWSYWYAFDCTIAAIVKLQEQPDHLNRTLMPPEQRRTITISAARMAQLTPHLVRLTHPYFQDVRRDIPPDRVLLADLLMILCEAKDQVEAAISFGSSALAVTGALQPEWWDIWRFDKLGGLYERQGKLAEAEQMYRRVLARGPRSFGPKDAQIPLAVERLAVLYYNQDKLAESEQMFISALAVYQETYGPQSLELVTIFENLGNVYMGQNHLDKAEQNYLQALTIARKEHGTDTQVSTLIHKLGAVYAKQAGPEATEPAYLHELTKREEILGPNHTSTLSIVYDLGGLYLSQGKLDDAERLITRALVGMEEAHGPEAPLVFDIISSLGLVYVNQRKPAEAEKLNLRALVGREKVLGPEHSSTTVTVWLLGVCYLNQGKLDEAKPLLLRALVGCKKLLGPDHNITQLVTHHLDLVRSRLKKRRQRYLPLLLGILAVLLHILQRYYQTGTR